MTTRRSARRAIFASGACWLAAAAPIGAQTVPTTITTDGTFGPATTITDGLDGAIDRVFTIEESMGSRPGGGANLFHSLGRFDVGAGDTARFRSSAGVDRIIARITGGDPSDVFGRIQSTDTNADLLLLNHSGFVFGAGSSLDVGGSVTLATADSLRMLPGDTRGTLTFSGDMALATASPEAFGFLGTPISGITVDGTTLQVDPGERLALVGGPITLTNAELRAPRGAVDLMSAGSRGEVSIDGSGAHALAAGTRGGDVRLTGSRVRVETDSVANAFATGISVEAASLELTSSFLTAVTNFDQQGADVRLRTDRLTMTDISEIQAEVGGFASGDGGSIDLVATASLSLADRSEISTTSEGNGDAGDIRVEAGDVLLQSGGAIEALALSSSGNGGDIDVTADSLRLEGGLVNGTLSQPSSISTTTGFFAGQAGDIRLDVGTLELVDGGRISAESLGSGAGGSIDVTARRVVVRGVNEELQALLPIVTGFDPPSSVGSIFLNVTRDEGFARSAIAATALNTTEFGSTPTGTGDAGSVRIDTGSLIVEDGGLVSANSETSGVAGSVDIMAGRVRLGEGGLVDSSSLQTQAAGVTMQAQAIRIEGGEVNASSGTNATSGGSILLDASQLLVAENGRITSNFDGNTGAGGDIDLAAPLVAIGGNTITANAAIANGGAIDISAGTLFDLGANVITATGGAAGGEGTVSVPSPVVNLASGLAPVPVTYLDASAMMRPACALRRVSGDESRFVVQTRRAIPASPEGMLLALDDAGGLDAGPLASSSPARAGASAYQAGAYDDAEASWTLASQRFEASGDSAGQLLALRGAAQSSMAAGRYADSLAPLEKALTLAEARGRDDETAAALGDLANASIALGELEAAEGYVTRGLALVESSSERDLVAQLLNILGNLEASRSTPRQALARYEQSAAAAEAAGDATNAARALSNGARAALEAGETERAHVLLGRAEAQLARLPAGRVRSYLLIHTARTHQQLALGAPTTAATSLLRAHANLREAIEASTRAGDERARSFALGNLGALYEVDGQTGAALELTRQALAAAERSSASEAAYRWHWQAGRLLWAQGRAEASIAAHRRAIAILEETRPASADRYDETQWSFEQSIQPVYLELASHLLESSDRIDQPATRQTVLAEARAAVERLRAAELRDYFADECVADLDRNRFGPDVLPAKTAILYPILFDDRLEVLLQTSGELTRHVARDADRERVERTAHAFREALQNPDRARHRPEARQLYDWLVAPFAAQLERRGVDTLVLVADGALRTIPMAALHDGRDYLVERFATASTPALGLIDAQPRDGGRERSTLLAGLSESVAGFPALEAVEEELAAVQGMTGGEILLNEGFERSRLAERFERESPAILHIASHAVFRGDPDESFLLAHDGRLTMDQLSALIGRGRLAEPLDLLVLSACETALGDERAGLGLAGVAVRAGARSALGSLWSIADRAASTLVRDFYRELATPGTSKAEALRRAQLALRRDERFAHPYFWSPYLLVNDWS
ncbi:MAG: CHAT domain-containing protein [Myxococcota bacterium]